MQLVHSFLFGKPVERELPPENAQVMPGVFWGRADDLMTPAYWAIQAWQHGQLGTYNSIRLGGTLAEEVAACLLGGYGMPAELGLAAYRRLRDLGYLTVTPSECEISKALSEPFTFGNAQRKYRFINQKSKYLAACLERLQNLDLALPDKRLRDELATLPGIGLKTASWIIRNYRDSDEVGVIDVHILRAGQVMRLYETHWTPTRNYEILERRFVEFADAIGARASLLDALMWDQMRRIPRHNFAAASAAKQADQLELELA